MFLSISYEIIQTSQVQKHHFFLFLCTHYIFVYKHFYLTFYYKNCQYATHQLPFYLHKVLIDNIYIIYEFIIIYNVHFYILFLSFANIVIIVKNFPFSSLISNVPLYFSTLSLTFSIPIP